MGLHLPPKSSLDGVPVAAIKRAVGRGFEQPADLPAFAALQAKGWAWRNDHGSVIVSKEGAALGSARLRARTPLADADAAFASLKRGIDALAAEGLVQPEVWIFGSYMRRCSHIGDLDVAVGLHIVGGYEDFMAGCAARYGDQPWHKARMRDRGRWMLSTYAARVVFGARMPSLCDGVEFSLEQALAGMPVQQVRTPEGWHTGPVLEHHPQARGPLPAKAPICVSIDQGTFSTHNTA